MAKRVYNPREWKLVYEYLITKYPNKLQWRRVRVGPLLKNEKLYGVLRRWVDAIVYDHEEDLIIIIEAKMKPEPGALSQLELYRKLFPQTPEFELYKDKPIKLVFLTTMLDKELKALAKEKGIDYVVFKPKWVEEYFKELMEKYARS